MLDRILRGEATHAAATRDGKLNIPAMGMIFVIDWLGIFYGACMGLFSLTPGGSGHWMQVLAAMLKVPSLFLLTLLVTFPSLYVFNVLVGSRLQLLSVLRLLIISLAVMLAVLASIGPIVAFFSFTTTSYPFMIVLNVAVFAVAGLIGLGFLLQTLHRMTHAPASTIASASAWDATALSAESSGGDTVLNAKTESDASASTSGESTATAANPGPLDHASDSTLAPHVKTVFRIWLIVFGLVGSQMAWVLRPFIGKPGDPFTWFRHPDSNFFQAVIHAIIRTF